MAFMGPLSSVFDILCFCSHVVDYQGKYAGTGSAFSVRLVRIRNRIPGSGHSHDPRGKIPFIQSLAAKPLLLSTAVVALSAILVRFSAMASGLDEAPLPLGFLPWLVLLLAGYCLSTQFLRDLYSKVWGMAVSFKRVFQEDFL